MRRRQMRCLLVLMLVTGCYRSRVIGNAVDSVDADATIVPSIDSSTDSATMDVDATLVDGDLDEIEAGVDASIEDPACPAADCRATHAGAPPVRPGCFVATCQPSSDCAFGPTTQAWYEAEDDAERMVTFSLDPGVGSPWLGTLQLYERDMVGWHAVGLERFATCFAPLCSGALASTNGTTFVGGTVVGGIERFDDAVWTGGVGGEPVNSLRCDTVRGCFAAFRNTIIHWARDRWEEAFDFAVLVPRTDAPGGVFVSAGDGNFGYLVTRGGNFYATDLVTKQAQLLGSVPRDAVDIDLGPGGMQIAVAAVHELNVFDTLGQLLHHVPLDEYEIQLVRFIGEDSIAVLTASGVVMLGPDSQRWYPSPTGYRTTDMDVRPHGLVLSAVALASAEPCDQVRFWEITGP